MNPRLLAGLFALAFAIPPASAGPLDLLSGGDPVKTLCPPADLFYEEAPKPAIPVKPLLGQLERQGVLVWHSFSSANPENGHWAFFGACELLQQIERCLEGQLLDECLPLCPERSVLVEVTCVLGPNDVRLPPALRLLLDAFLQAPLEQ